MFIAHNFQINHVKRWDFVLILETLKRIIEALAEHGESNFRVLCSLRKPLPDSMKQKPADVSRLENLRGLPSAAEQAEPFSQDEPDFCPAACVFPALTQERVPE